MSSNLFYALRNFYLSALSGMTWKDVLDLGPTAISRAIGCPVTTASAWIHRGGPAPWLQKLTIESIGQTSPNKRDAGNGSKAARRVSKA